MGYLVAVSLVWAFSFGLTKGKLAGVDSTFVSAVRLTLAWLVFLPFLQLRRASSRQLLIWLGVGAVQFGAMYLALNESYRYLPAHLVALFTCVTPIWILVLAGRTEGGVRISTWVAATLSVVAGAVLSFRAEATQTTWLGIALVQFANVCFALGQILYRKFAPVCPLSPAQRFTWLYAGAVLLVLPIAAWRVKGVAIEINEAQALTLLYLGVLASGLCFFGWNKGAAKVSPGVLAVMNNAKVPLAVACSLLFFKESAELVSLTVASALLALALWLVRD